MVARLRIRCHGGWRSVKGAPGRVPVMGVWQPFNVLQNIDRRAADVDGLGAGRRASGQGWRGCGGPSSSRASISLVSSLVLAMVVSVRLVPRGWVPVIIMERLARDKQGTFSPRLVRARFSQVLFPPAWGDLIRKIRQGPNAT